MICLIINIEPHTKEMNQGLNQIPGIETKSSTLFSPCISGTFPKNEVKYFQILYLIMYTYPSLILD